MVVAIFEHQGKRKIRLHAYTRDYNPQWSGCCLHNVPDGLGRKLAIAAAKMEHEDYCMKNREAH